MSLPTHHSDASVQPSVGIAGHGGMPGMPSLPPQQKKDEGQVEPSPQLRISTPVDEVYHSIGSANDIIVVEGAGGTFYVTDFSVMFSRKVRAKGGKPDAPGSLYTVNKAVQTYINGKLQPQLYMRVKEDGFCTFPDGSCQPRPEALSGGLGLVLGINNVRFEIRYFPDSRVLVAECYAFLWEIHTPVIVMDIDGTITRSDVPGLIMTLTPGFLDCTHSGICDLLTRIASEGAVVMYLTSRPIVLAAKTRAFLLSTKQGDTTLPVGPLQCCLEKLTGVIWRELVAKNMHEYKMNALLDLSRVFRNAGRAFGEPVFAAGIGNKLTDAVAYRGAGIPPDFIFLIDTESHLQVWDGDSSKLGGGTPGVALSPPHLKQSREAQLSPQLYAHQNPRPLKLSDRGTRWLFGEDKVGSGKGSSSRGGSAGSDSGKSIASRSSSSGSSGSTKTNGSLVGVDSATLSGDPASATKIEIPAVGVEAGGAVLVRLTSPLARPAASAPDFVIIATEEEGLMSITDDGEQLVAVPPPPRTAKSEKMSDAAGVMTLTATAGVYGASSQAIGNEGEVATAPLTPAPSQAEHAAAAAAAATSADGVSVTRRTGETLQRLPSPGYVTYADERLFHLLKHSVTIARGQVNRNQRRESVEDVESRLAERVLEMSAYAGSGHDGHVDGSHGADGSRRSAGVQAEVGARVKSATEGCGSVMIQERDSGS